MILMLLLLCEYLLSVEFQVAFRNGNLLEHYKRMTIVNSNCSKINPHQNKILIENSLSFILYSQKKYNLRITNHSINPNFGSDKNSIEFLTINLFLDSNLVFLFKTIFRDEWILLFDTYPTNQNKYPEEILFLTLNNYITLTTTTSSNYPMEEGNINIDLGSLNIFLPNFKVGIHQPNF